jgi:anhydro-N-acetylmuramic acid kinase
MSAASGLYIGIMTGTSLDGIDCVVAAFDESPNILSFYTQQIPTTVRNELLLFATEKKVDLEQLVRMHFVLAQLYATTVKECLQEAKIDPQSIEAIGLHGQTIRHVPKKIAFHADFPPMGATFQLGSGAALAALTGIDVVHDFRSADVALGGEGAPLVPMFDARFLRSKSIDRIALNIGGIANITYLPRWEKGIMAFDTGPGNMLIDALAEKYFGVSYDEDGTRASQATVDEELLQRLLEHHYFAAPPPKSTGRELFGQEFSAVFDTKIESGELLPADALCTATELTARTISDAIRSVHAKTETPEIIVSGGGARNRFLMQRLQELLPTSKISELDAYGISSHAKEALAFAYFAKAWKEDQRIHLPETTGASRAILLGSLSKGT